MKKISAICLAAIIALNVSACAKDTAPAVNETQKAPSSQAQTVSTAEVQPTQALKFPNFSTVDLNGNTVTQEIFKENKLTLINLWATS